MINDSRLALLLSDFDKLNQGKIEENQYWEVVVY